MRTRSWVIAIVIVVIMGGGLWLLSPILVPVPDLSVAFREALQKEASRAKEQDSKAEVVAEKRRGQLKESCAEELKGTDICSVHHENLRPDVVKIGYGLNLPNPGREEAEAKFFPNSNKIVHGDCIAGIQEFACISYCQRCRQAESEWDAQHRQVSQVEVTINEADFETVPASEGTSHLIKKVEPYYPRLAEQASISAVVKLQLFVDETGKVIHVKVRSGHPLLYEAAVSAVNQWKYKPFLRNHKPAKVITDAKVSFTAESKLKNRVY